MKREPIPPIHEGPNRQPDRVSLVLMPNVQHPGNNPEPIPYATYKHGERQYPGYYTPVVFTMIDTPDNRELLDYIGELLNGATTDCELIVSVNNQPVYGGAQRVDFGTAFTDWGSLQIYEEQTLTTANGPVRRWGSWDWAEWQPRYSIRDYHN